MRSWRNKKYPYYENPEIRDLKDLLAIKAEAHPDKPCFVYPVDGGQKSKTYLDLYNDVNALGSWMYARKLQGKNFTSEGDGNARFFLPDYGSACQVKVKAYEEA